MLVHDIGIVRSQFFDLSRPCPLDNSLVRLQIGVVECSLRDYLLRPDFRRDVRAWVELQHGFGPFSFESVCTALGVDADYARGALGKWMGRIDRGERVARHDSIDMRLKALPTSSTLVRPRYRGRYRPRRRPLQ